MNEKTLTTDVLVIGAGGAGLRAAIAARNKNVDVLVVSKGLFPEGCNTHAAGGVMLAPLNSEDSPEKYFKDTMTAGGGMNYPGLVKILTDNAAQRALDLEQYGIDYARDKGKIRVWPTPDGTVPRALPGGQPYSGDWFKCLVDEVARLNIPVLDQFVVMDLIKDHKSLAGAVGFEKETDTFVTVLSKSIVLATGGAGSIYAFTSNDPGITGDGLGMAYRAGAALSHLEFVQMRQCIIHPEGLKGMLPPFDGFVATGGRFYNGIHERYMKRYHPDRSEAVTRAEMATCAQLEIMAGKHGPHGGVYGDLSDVPPDTLMSTKKFMTACRKANFDPAFQSYEWAPASHYCMGGVVISESCETSVPGLFAAGEVVAGIQGANRMGGNALTETQVFGAIAGKTAADRSRVVKKSSPGSQTADRAKQRISTLLKKDSGSDHEAVRVTINEIMSQHVGVIRNEGGLGKAEAVLEKIETGQIHDLCLTRDRSLNSMSRLLEVEHLLTLARLMARAARIRTESRGTHQRQDFPGTDKAWEKHLVFQINNIGPALVPVAQGLPMSDT
ncbi:FAD-binding protein [Desulfobacula sp.]|uniref:FAD-binding protein n=1 Tax=Desulfobacula sp. TaxID=2593537 RepID=UPI0026266A52|nr:FAD-binding protein [Desulfobacula sp.]